MAEEVNNSGWSSRKFWTMMIWQGVWTIAVFSGIVTGPLYYDLTLIGLGGYYMGNVGEHIANAFKVFARNKNAS